MHFGEKKWLLVFPWSTQNQFVFVTDKILLLLELLLCFLYFKVYTWMNSTEKIVFKTYVIPLT